MAPARVGIVVGSASDLPTLQPARDLLDRFGVGYELRVLSAHRTPAAATEFASTALERGLQVLIAAAGLAAHLPGALAAQTPLPVIGVPVASGSLGGIDALLAIVQMPRGVPVATVAIGGAANAALLAVQMLSLADDALRQQLIAYRAEQAKGVLEQDAKLREA
ncbi:MAG: 5-(carboxyamino)imidazole ribonucleotide mutase [Chloroflexi bacterium]|nr:5-(carboxyamino)imidazole ribonucleotide mutase [Chloroflexota bacterium]